MDKEFYKQLKAFLKELVIVFPEDDDELQLVTTSINLAIIDENDLITKFYNSLSHLEDKIFHRNRVFINDIQWDSSRYEYQLFSKLNEQWETFSEVNQNVIWDYIHVLFALSKQFTLKNAQFNKSEA